MDLDILVLQQWHFFPPTLISKTSLWLSFCVPRCFLRLRVTIVTDTAEVKNAATSPYIFMVCRLIKHGDNFMFSGTADKMSRLFPLYAYRSRNEKMDENGAR